MCSINCPFSTIIITFAAIAIPIWVGNLFQPVNETTPEDHPTAENTNTGSGYGTSAVNTAWRKLQEGLHSVRVSKHDATAVQRELEGELVRKWEEKFETMESRRISMDKLQKFLDHLQQAYEGIDARIRKKMEGILFSKEWAHKIFEFKIKQKENSGAHYGMLAFGKSDDEEMVDCMYVLYKMDFEVAPEEQFVTKDHSVLWGLIHWQTTDFKTVERRIGLKTLNKLRNFLHYKALNAFYKEGYIDSINYVNSIENATAETEEIS